MRLESFALALLVSVTAPCLAGAAPPPSARLVVSWHPGAWQPAAAVEAGMRIAIDPVTGELTELPALDPALAGARPARLSGQAPLVRERRADGSMRVMLGGQLRAYMVARIAADGRLELDCEHGATPSLPAPPAEDR